MIAANEPAQGVVVVVPALNEAHGIERVLHELLAGLPAQGPAEIVVADGGSTDGTQALVTRLAEHDPRVRLVANPRRLQSAAMNLVARQMAGRARWLVRADAHAAYPARFVADVVAALERTGADSVVVPMDSRGTTRSGRAIAWVSDTRIGSGGSAHRGGRKAGWIDHGHHAGWNLDSYLAAGGYDESYSHNEDAEFDCRMTRLGGRIWIEPAIRLTYFVRPSLIALWRQYHAYGRGRSRTVRRHPSSMRIRQFLVPAGVSAVSVSALAAPFDPLLWMVPGAYVSVLASASLGLAVRHRSGCGLLGGPAALVMHFAWASGFIGGLVIVRERAWGPPGHTDRAILMQERGQ
jgi:succinoglycan biosynthesis protein ExoA